MKLLIEKDEKVYNELINYDITNKFVYINNSNRSEVVNWIFGIS